MQAGYGQPDATDWAAAARARVPGFVARHFTWPGTLRLHRAALGADILRAPVNVALSPVLVLTRLAAMAARRLRLRRAGAWLASRRVLLPTAVAAGVEARVADQLLGVTLPPGADGAARIAAILEAPQFRDRFRRAGTPAQAQAIATRISQALAEYAGTRSAIADLTVSLVTIATGAILFRAVTPGLVSMAPGLAEALSHTVAVEDFPLGSTLGAAWYGVFPVATPGWMVAGAVAAMVMVGSVAGAFAGVIADPLQARTGIHTRRLHRLIDTVDAELDRLDRPFVAREHYLARVFDLWDAALGITRLFRG
ncbi:MAG: hypothetical protein MUF73_15515 [Rhodobacteraceae bacterium]|jgi:hypothetical protein|nr:hypothetical protein [Paracoccaceae bacterium]